MVVAEPDDTAGTSSSALNPRLRSFAALRIKRRLVPAAIALALRVGPRTRDVSGAVSTQIASVTAPAQGSHRLAGSPSASPTGSGSTSVTAQLRHHLDRYPLGDEHRGEVVAEIVEVQI